MMPDNNTLETLTIKLTPVEPDTLFLREGWMAGEAEDGTKVALERTFGSTIILRKTDPDGTERVSTIDVGELLGAWAVAVSS